jgi:hypothetical protein
MAKDKPPKGEKRRHELERLESGELDGARAWAQDLATAAASFTQTLPSATPAAMHVAHAQTKRSTPDDSRFSN